MSKQNKIKYERYLTDKTHLKVTDGNEKVGKGIFCVNLLSGDKPLKTKDGTLLTNVSGTCSGCCDECKNDCYGIRCQLYKNNNIPTWADNTLLAVYETETFFKELQQFIDRSMIAAIRYHAFGEIPSYKYLIGMVNIAKDNPMIYFYTYTKRFKWIEKYIKENGNFPNNLVINMSIWHKNYDNPYNLPEFIYDDGTEKQLNKIPHCPAVDKNGHKTGITCANCKKCFMAKNGSKIAVYSH